MVTILIVEDELIIQEYLQKILSTIDCEMQILKTQAASEAIMISRLYNIDIFLLDIQLLDFSGFELATKIREMEAYKLTPIVFLTGVETKELQAFKDVHCYDYIIKPFGEEKVKSTIETIINYGVLRNEDISIVKLKKKENTFMYKQDDIIYFEIKDRNLIVKTVHDINEFTQYTLKSIEQDLDDKFIRCHKSYIINENYIHHIDHPNNLLYLMNTKEAIPYGRRFKKYFKALADK